VVDVSDPANPTELDRRFCSRCFSYPKLLAVRAVLGERVDER
jgi:hypothetical protein